MTDYAFNQNKIIPWPSSDTLGSGIDASELDLLLDADPIGKCLDKTSIINSVGTESILPQEKSSKDPVIFSDESSTYYKIFG